MAGSHAQAILDAAGRKGWTYRQPLSDPDDARVLTSCAHCGATVDGTLGAGRQWFAEHRRQVHSELAEPAPRQAGWRRRAASVGSNGVPRSRNGTAEAASQDGAG